jgi:hypothetical protein
MKSETAELTAENDPQAVVVPRAAYRRCGPARRTVQGRGTQRAGIQRLKTLKKFGFVLPVCTSQLQFRNFNYLEKPAEPMDPRSPLGGWAYIPS